MGDYLYSIRQKNIHAMRTITEAIKEIRLVDEYSITDDIAKRAQVIAEGITEEEREKVLQAWGELNLAHKHAAEADAIIKNLIIYRDE